MRPVIVVFIKPSVRRRLKLRNGHRPVTLVKELPLERADEPPGMRFVFRLVGPGPVLDDVVFRKELFGVFFVFAAVALSLTILISHPKRATTSRSALFALRFDGDEAMCIMPSRLPLSRAQKA